MTQSCLNVHYGCGRMLMCANAICWDIQLGFDAKPISIACIAKSVDCSQQGIAGFHIQANSSNLVVFQGIYQRIEEGRR